MLRGIMCKPRPINNALYITGILTQYHSAVASVSQMKHEDQVTDYKGQYTCYYHIRVLSGGICLAWRNIAMFEDILENCDE